MPRNKKNPKPVKGIPLSELEYALSYRDGPRVVSEIFYKREIDRIAYKYAYDVKEVEAFVEELASMRRYGK